MIKTIDAKILHEYYYLFRRIVSIGRSTNWEGVKITFDNGEEVFCDDAGYELVCETMYLQPIDDGMKIAERRKLKTIENLGPKEWEPDCVISVY